MVIDKRYNPEFWVDLNKKTRRERAIINGVLAAILLQEKSLIIKTYTHSRYCYDQIPNKEIFLKFIVGRTFHEFTGMTAYEVIDENPITVMIHIQVIIEC